MRRSGFGSNHALSMDSQAEITSTPNGLEDDVNPSFEGTDHGEEDEELIRDNELRRNSLWYRNVPLLLLTAFSGIAGFLFGYDTGNISGALPYIEDELLAGYKSNPRRLHVIEGLIVSGAIVGAAIGSAGGGVVSDRLGRKAALKMADVFFLAGSLTMACSHSAVLLITGRVLLGLGIGLASVTAPVYIAETAPASIRATLVTFNTLMITCGQLAAYFLSYLFTFTTATWRWMVGVAALPALIQIIGLAFLPESPRWLRSKGRDEEAGRVLVLLSHSADQDGEIQAAVPHQRSKGVTEAFASNVFRKELKLGVGLQVWQQLCGINTVMYYTPFILRLAGVVNNRTALLLAMGPAAVNALGTVIGMYLVDRIGRRKLLLGSLAGIVLALCLLGTAFKLSESHAAVVVENSCSASAAGTCAACVQDGCRFCPSRGAESMQGTCVNSDQPCPSTVDLLLSSSNSCPNPYFVGIILNVVLYLAAFSPGMGTVPWCVNAEIFPVEVIGLANGLSATANWVTNAIVSQLFLTLADYMGTSGVFWLIAGVALLGCLWVHLHLPETKGLSFEAIQKLFASKQEQESDDESRPSGTGE